MKDHEGGLTEKEVLLKQGTQGKNSLISEGELDEGGTLIWRYMQQYNNPLILLLLASAGVSVLLRQYENAASIGIAVVIVTTFAFVQESRSEESLKALQRLSPPQCLVVREGKARTMLAEDLVVGDRVRLLRGSRVPADVQVEEATADLVVDESMFTGESVPVPKQGGEGKSARLLMGTMVMEGHAEGTVRAIGRATELGKLTAMVRETEEPKTPLQSQLDALGARLSVWSGVVIALIGLVGWLQGQALLRIFTTAVSLAVAAIPEGLPIVATITLALGVLRLATRGVLVRKLTAVEGLGSIQILCVDKTGTLTENRLSLDRVVLILKDGGRAAEADVLRLAALCTDKSSPLDALILEQAPFSDDAHVTLLQHFSSHTKWMAVQTARGEVIAKGALECLPLAKRDDAIKEQAARLGSEGHRVIAVATGTSLDDLCVLGLLCFRDEPRKGMHHVVQELSGLGVRLLMITGDARETAEAIARSIGWPEGEAMAGGGKLSLGTSIVYRATPQHKLQIIQTLQSKQKLIVSMVGDGVNDAAALKKADIGVAMGGPRGTDVAREAARIVLTDDNLESLVTGIREGRCIFRNIRSFIKFQVSVSMALLLLVAYDSLLSPSAPPVLTAFQILLINIIMDGPPAQSLGVEPEDETATSPQPSALLSVDLFLRSILSALITVFLSCIVAPHLAGGANPPGLVFNTLVIVTLANAFCCRNYTQSSLRLHRLFANKALILAVCVSAVSLLVIDYVKGVGMRMVDWSVAFSMAAAYVGLDEVIKRTHHRFIAFPQQFKCTLPAISFV